MWVAHTAGNTDFGRVYHRSIAVEGFVVITVFGEGIAHGFLITMVAGEICKKISHIGVVGIALSGAFSGLVSLSRKSSGHRSEHCACNNDFLHRKFIVK